MAVLRMSREELSRYDTMVRVDRGELHADDAASLLGVTRRQVFRLLVRLRADGAEGLISRKRGCPSNRRHSDDFRASVAALVREHYPDFGPSFAAEKLAERHDIRISHEALRKLMIAEGLWMDRKARRARVYQPRYRRDCVGELIQIDGSQHWWFEDRGPKATLLVFIDDATSRLMHLAMEPSENALAYMQATRDYIARHGKPVAFYSDKHSVFRNVNASAARGDGRTQFGRALADLNIEIICANSAPAKGRVERVHQTLQDRMVKEMRLAGISTIADANAFFPGFIEKHNARFARAPLNEKDLHRPLADHEDLDLTMVWREERTLSAALTLHYNKIVLILDPSDVSRALARKRVTIYDYPDGRLEIRHDGVSLPYRVFDKLRRVHQASIVDGQRLGAALEMARQMQVINPHRREGSKCVPSRRSQGENLFQAASRSNDNTGQIKRGTHGPLLKRGPRLSDEELIRRGVSEFIRTQRPLPPDPHPRGLPSVGQQGPPTAATASAPDCARRRPRVPPVDYRDKPVEEAEATPTMTGHSVRL